MFQGDPYVKPLLPPPALERSSAYKHNNPLLFLIQPLSSILAPLADARNEPCPPTFIFAILSSPSDA